MRKEEVDHSCLTVFGILLDSRHGRAYELKEMIDFAIELTRHSINRFVKSVFYDSKSCTCSYVLSDEIPTMHSLVRLALNEATLECAKKTISQFEVNGTIHHGGKCNCSDCSKLKVVQVSSRAPTPKEWQS